MRVIPFMRYKWWFIVSLSAVTIFAVIAIFAVGLDLGIDFKGGVRMQVGLEKQATEDEVRSVVRDLGIQEPVVQTVKGASGTYSFMITAEEMDETQQDAVEAALESKFGVDEGSFAVERVGGSFSKETTNRAFIAIAIAVVAIIGYLTLRFEFKFAIPAIVSLIHDVGLTLGIYAASNRLVTAATVAAILTILGYSVHDTIVIFDRMRENTHLMKKETYGEMADLSIAQTVVRSINTTICVLLPLLAILIFGGPTLKDFAFALTIGVITGTYSSFFVATPLAVLWKEREPRYRKRLLAAAAGMNGGVDVGAVAAEGPSKAGVKTAPAPAGGAKTTTKPQQPRVSQKPKKGKTTSKRPAGKGAKRTSR
ncbi:MAG: protein translocase subunit SecF [Thermoleophilia bacterium]|nr:protein translocase subunit SecF [Thermoleophilia bacterium]